MRVVLCCVPALLVSALAAQSAVLVVDPANGPGTDFTSLPAAVSAAASGDVLLRCRADHGEIVSDGKGLVLVADTGASVSLDKLTVQNVPAGASVAVRGVTIDTGPSTPGALTVKDCPGSVWFDACRVNGT